MGKKKEEKLTEAAADFFGDDVDWLDDEDEDASPTLPVAPPVDPEVPAPAVEPLATEPGWASRISDVPLDPKHLANAPTLTFSAVPTLPPSPAPDLSTAAPDLSKGEHVAPVAAEDEPTVEADRAVLAEMGAASAARASAPQSAVAVTPSRAPRIELATLPPPDPSAPPLVDEDTREEEVEEELVDAIPSSPPAPARVATPAPVSRRAKPPAADGAVKARMPRVSRPPAHIDASGPTSPASWTEPKPEAPEPKPAEAPKAEEPEPKEPEVAQEAPPAAEPEAAEAEAPEAPAPVDAPDASDDTTMADASPTTEADEAPAAPAAPPLERWEPGTEEQRWRDVATAMVAEAAQVGVEQRSVLLFEAGEVYQTRLDDRAGAEALYRDAAAAGSADAAHQGRLHQGLAQLARRAERWDEALEHLDRRAEALTGAAKADVLMEAALHARHRLKDLDAATARARHALKAEPDSYAALSVLRDLLIDRKDAVGERAEVLGRLAEASDGYLAAEARVEQGRLLRELQRGDEAVEALRLAVEACPSHPEAFLALTTQLAEAGEHRRLAEVYEREANRQGPALSPDAHDPGWWWLEAARAWAAAGESAHADACYDRALQAGYLFAERERQGALQRADAHEALAASVAREVEALAAADVSEGLAHLWFRLGWLREHHLSDPEGALEAYLAAVQLDALAEPAADGVVRILRSKGDVDALVTFLEGRLPAMAELAAHAVRLLLAQLAERRGDDAAGARWWREIVDRVEDNGLAASCLARLAVDGLMRCLRRQGRFDELAALHVRRAEAEEDPAQRAAHLHRAASVGPREAPDVAAAVALHHRVLELVPDHVESIAALESLTEQTNERAAYAAALRAAGEVAAEPTRQAALLYRSGRVFADLGLLDSAREAVERCLDQVPGFQPALDVLAEAVADDPGVRVALYRRHAEHAASDAGRAWSLFAAACMGEPSDARADLRAILEIDAAHPGALAALEVQCLADDDWTQLVGLYDRALVGEPTPDKARLSVRVAEIMRALDRREEAVQVLSDLVVQDVVGRPLRAAARIAASLGAWDQAVQLLEPLQSPEDRLERARILARKLRQTGPALTILKQLMDEEPEDLGVCIHAARVGFQAEDREAMVEAQGRVARSGQAPGMVAAYAAWTAAMLDGEGRVDDALTYWRLALESRPAGGEAFEGAARALVALSDAAGVRALYETYRPDDRRGLARSLEAAGDDAGAIEVLRGEVERDGLPVMLSLEQLLMRIGDWQGVYDQLVARKGVTADGAQLASIDARRRWVLAEKLAETDAAWELYRQLHDEDPADRAVTEALARIAAARGDAALSIQYLKELAVGASEAEEAARYQRRIGRVHEDAGDVASARQAYLDALDHVPHDRDALDGLKRLAEREEDWSALISVLQREAGISEPARQLELRREIAQVTEERLKDPAVAMDAWRAVLDLAPQDVDALSHLLDLAERGKEWGVVVETGRVLAALSAGVERSRLLCRIGVVCQEQLDRDDAIRYFEQAISGNHPVKDAAKRLEELYRARADWNGAIRALGVQADVAEDREERVSALLRAARLETETRHDREAASGYYARVLELEEDHEESLRFMASHLFEAGRFDEALPVCERLEPVVEVGQDLDDFDTRMELATFHFYYAEMLRLAFESERALPQYERALALNPTHLASLEAVGPLYTGIGAWKKAEKVYRQLLQLSGGQGDRSKVASTYAQLGLVERELGNRDKAYKRFNKALEIFPNHVDALKGMALILEDREEWNNLLNVYNNIIYHATVPQHVIDAYMTKGRILDDRMARPDKAAQHYQRSLDFDADQPLAYLRLAELAMRRDAYAEGGELAHKGLALDESGTDTIHALLLLCVMAADKDAGRDPQVDARLAEIRQRDRGLADALPAAPLDDLEALRQLIRDHLPV